MPATQQFLQFDTIRDGVIVLKNGDLRAILAVSALNFALKSQDEQEAIIFAFRNFLNSLDFDLQILIHSHRLNLKQYLAALDELHRQQQNELLAVQTAEYIEFIKAFIAEVNVMSKSFYVVVPFSTQTAKIKENPLKAFGGLIPGAGKRITLDPVKFQYYKTELLQRVEFTIQGLHSVGLRATMLTSGEIIEALWRLYNPDKAESEEAPVLESQTLVHEFV